MTAPIKYSVGAAAYATPFLNEITENQRKNSQLNIKNSLDINDVSFGLKRDKDGSLVTDNGRIDQSQGIVFQQATHLQEQLEASAQATRLSGIGLIGDGAANGIGAVGSLAHLTAGENTIRQNNNPNEAIRAGVRVPAANEEVELNGANNGPRPVNADNAEVNVAGNRPARAGDVEENLEAKQDNESIRRTAATKADAFSQGGRSLGSIFNGSCTVSSAAQKDKEAQEASLAAQYDAVKRLNEIIAQQFQTQVQGADAASKAAQDTAVAVVQASSRV